MALVLDGSAGVSGVDGTASNPAIEGTDSNTGVFFPAADTVAIGTGGTERLRVDSSGNVGVGTSSPGARLNVSGSNPAGYIANWIDNTASNGYARLDLRIGSSGANGQGTVAYAPGIFMKIGPDANDTTTPLVFATNNATERMRIDSSGNVGIGTSSPSSFSTYRYLDLVGGGTSTGGIFQSKTSNGAVVNTLYTTGSAGAIGTATNHPLQFLTNDTERGRFTSGGDFYVGDPNNTLGSTRLYIKGDGTNPASRIWANTSTTSVYGLVVRHDSTTAGAYIQFVTDSSVETGRIYDLAGTMQYASSSDARLKTNVQPMQNSLQSVLALNPCTFDMRRGEDAFIPSAGLIAQEVHEVYPFVVGVGGDDENTNPWSVDYGKLTPLLVAAIKELNAKVEAQAAEIALLKGAA